MAAQTNDGPFFLDRRHRRLLIYGRLGALAMLNFYSKDGLPYRDIKEALALPDGSLGPNIMWLKEEGLIKLQNGQDTNSTAIYQITDKGTTAYKKIKDWILMIMNEGVELKPVRK